jgi:DDE superfamily endonuclease
MYSMNRSKKGRFLVQQANHFIFRDNENSARRDGGGRVHSHALSSDRAFVSVCAPEIPKISSLSGASPCPTKRLGDTWHLDELFVNIQGRLQYLWRAVDQDGDVIDILVQPRRDQHAAERFFRKLLKGQGCVPRRLITDKLRSYSMAHGLVMPLSRTLALRADRKQGKRSPARFTAAPEPKRGKVVLLLPAFLSLPPLTRESATPQTLQSRTLPGGVSDRHPEQWAYDVCPASCGTFHYRQRTRRFHRVADLVSERRP